MKKMYLVQRGTFREDIIKEDKVENTPLTGRGGLLDLDYMGSAEFEFGALHFSYCMIFHGMENGDHYNLHETDIRNPNGVPLLVYCHKDQIQTIEANLKEFLDKNNPKNVSTYMLKEYISFAHKYYGFRSGFGHESDNFWWDIQNDFMFFFAGPTSNRVRIFLRCLQNDYKNMWLSYTEEVKAEKYEKAHRSMYGRY